MKKNIHPNYRKSTVECICSNTWETKSTLESIKVELCSACHPFFTGKQKLIDTAGRVDKFKARMEAANAAKEKKDRKPTKEEKPKAETKDIKKEK
jgi:large subunit ribosomal protein L31